MTDELRGLLRCGDFEHSFLRFACRRCGDELRVPFSCKGRGVCPSCLLEIEHPGIYTLELEVEDRIAGEKLVHEECFVVE